MAETIVTIPDTNVSSVLLANTAMIPHCGFNIQEISKFSHSSPFSVSFFLCLSVLTSSSGLSRGCRAELLIGDYSSNPQ